MSKNNSSNNTEADIRKEMQTTVEAIRDTKKVMHDRTRRVRPPVFRDLNPVSQLMPQVCEEFFDNGLAMFPNENRPGISLPEEFCGFQSVETSSLLSVLLDSNDSRMLRLLERIHIRAMLREDRYYQIVDDPSLYCTSKTVDLPAFHNRVVLYLTTPAVLVYLRQTAALSLFSQVYAQGVLPRTNKMIARRENRQPKRRQPQADFESVLAHEKDKVTRAMPFFDVHAFQYATYVHCYEGDILRFQLDYLAVKRHYMDALPILMEMKWHPNFPSVLLYRRLYYQYATPFLDWVDMIRYQLKSSPTISVTGFYDKLLNARTELVDIDDMKFLGYRMLECMELRRLTKANCPAAKDLHGLYAGRKVFKDKEPMSHTMFKAAFERVTRPVMPHACSPLRRFLAHLYYHDRRTMTSMPQMLALVEYLLHQDFFTMHPLCRGSSIRYEPLIFQIYDFVWCIRKNRMKQNIYLRNETWEVIKHNEDAYVLYQRWDVLNCICILLGIGQNAIQRDMDPQLVERVIKLIIEVLRNSEYLETFMTYSYFDTFMGLSCTVNCLPNLTPKFLLRVLQTAPFQLADCLTVNQLLNTFSERFWLSGPAEGDADFVGSTGRPRTMSQISEFLMTRSRRMSVREAPVADAGDAVSGMSGKGSHGAVVLLCRDFAEMQKVTPIDELTSSEDRGDAARREEEERQHVADYSQMETDFRYGQIFTDAYFMATGRPKIFFDESLTYKACKTLSKESFVGPKL